MPNRSTPSHARPLLMGLVLLLVSPIYAEGHGQNASSGSPAAFSDAVMAQLAQGGMNGQCRDLIEAYPIPCDWICQDTQNDMGAFINAQDPEALLHTLISRCRAELNTGAQTWKRTKETPGDLKSLLNVYLAACESRRIQRLAKLRDTFPRIVFLKNIEHGNAPRGPLSLSNDLRKGQPFTPGASICLLDLSDPYGQVVTLLQDPEGMLRDLDVSYDGERILFSWKKSARHDDFHLYEMRVRDRHITQITSEPGVADIQARYLPDRIVYHSSRCVNVVVCNETIDTVNLYSCKRDGTDIRRLGYDQVSTQFPSVLQDGRVLYTRWEYNDRGQIFPQGLFVMNPDGSAQMALYGNNSWYPTSLIQARGIPASNKLVTILAGHHTPPCGKLALIDLNQGQDEGKGISLIAPRRALQYERKDVAGQDDVLFQYPFPLNEDEFLVGFSLCGKKQSHEYGLYYMHSNGRRELLAWDFVKGCRQPIPLAPRPLPQPRPDLTVPDEATGTFYVDNIYAGQGLGGIRPGSIEKLRVIALDYRAAAIGTSFNNGPAGNARLDTPISIGGAWDVKQILGDAEVYADGSASFIVPARMPIYFQAIDKKGRAVQSMRSWSTLQPGETFACAGCHESRNRAPNSDHPKTIAQIQGPQTLSPFYGPARGFSFLKEIQPILDRHCIRCHQDHSYRPPMLTGAKEETPIYCFWPTQYSRSPIKQALYHLPQEQQLGRVSIEWLTQGVKAVTPPKTWRLFYRSKGTWTCVPDASDARNILLPPGVHTKTLKLEAELGQRDAGGIATWRVYDAEGRDVAGVDPKVAFNLSERKVYEDLSARAWTESYLSLVRAGFRQQGNVGYYLAAYPNQYVHWISPQSGPDVLEPYSFGSSQSRLIALLEAGHEEIRLSREEMDKLACWIDLAIPYCGDYAEANLWTETNKQDYKSRVAERRRLSYLQKGD
jgi:hypothetical protein